MGFLDVFKTAPEQHDEQNPEAQSQQEVIEAEPEQSSEEVNCTENIYDKSLENLNQQLLELRQTNRELEVTNQQLRSEMQEMREKLRARANTDTPTPEKEMPKEAKETPKGTTDSTNTEKVCAEINSSALEEKISAILKELVAAPLTASLEKLESAVKSDIMELQKSRDLATEKFEKLSGSVTEDRYRKDKVKVLRRTIAMRGLIIDVLQTYESEKFEGSETEAANWLKRQLEQLIKGIDADLKQEMVFILQNGTEGSDFDDNLQEAIGSEPTNNPELNGKVARSVSPGYYWTLPYILKPRFDEDGNTIHSYKFIISYEQVVTYRLRK